MAVEHLRVSAWPDSGAGCLSTSQLAVCSWSACSDFPHGGMEVGGKEGEEKGEAQREGEGEKEAVGEEDRNRTNSDVFSVMAMTPSQEQTLMTSSNPNYLQKCIYLNAITVRDWDLNVYVIFRIKPFHPQQSPKIRDILQTLQFFFIGFLRGFLMCKFLFSLLKYS